MEEIELVFDILNEQMNKALEHLDHELVKLRTGKASPALVADIKVDYYGTPTPLKQVANIQLSDARTIAIQPWERNQIPPIERAIINANLGMAPQNDGEQIRLTVPPLTEDRRKDLCKKAKAYGEDSKIAVRQARQKALDEIRKAVKDGYPEDLGKRKEGELQAIIKGTSDKIDSTVSSKETEIMTV